MYLTWKRREIGTPTHRAHRVLQKLVIQTTSLGFSVVAHLPSLQCATNHTPNPNLPRATKLPCLCRMITPFLPPLAQSGRKATRHQTRARGARASQPSPDWATGPRIPHQFLHRIRREVGRWDRGERGSERGADESHKGRRLGAWENCTGVYEEEVKARLGFASDGHAALQFGNARELRKGNQCRWQCRLLTERASEMEKGRGTGYRYRISSISRWMNIAISEAFIQMCYPYG